MKKKIQILKKETHKKNATKDIKKTTKLKKHQKILKEIKQKFQINLL